MREGSLASKARRMEEKWFSERQLAQRLSRYGTHYTTFYRILKIWLDLNKMPTTYLFLLLCVWLNTWTYYGNEINRFCFVDCDLIGWSGPILGSSVNVNFKSMLAYLSLKFLFYLVILKFLLLLLVDQHLPMNSTLEVSCDGEGVHLHKSELNLNFERC